VRRLLFGAVLVALLTILTAAPALAATSKQAVSPNEYRIGQSLIKAGLVPPFATGAQIEAAVRTYLKGAQPLHRELKLPQVQRALSGKKSTLARYLAARTTDPSAAETYTSNCLVILVEFGDDPWPSGSQVGHNTDGPLHGDIPAPVDDNATFWPGDFSRSHYQDMLFGNSFAIYDDAGALRGTSTDTMANYYLEQSKDIFTVSGQAAGWVQLRYPESWYGADESSAGDDNLNGPVWRVIRDAVAQLAADDPTFDWARYDKENPYGIVPGGFDQPDGYVDHLVVIHAGVDQSAGGGLEGDDAIWAHSWWVYDQMSGGPGNNPGYSVPGSSGSGPGGRTWVGAYTIDPEDGGIGVFSHEFGHDLGLPDEYDYDNLGLGTEEPSGFWTLMASGSWLGDQWGLDTAPAPMNVWDKWYLGFVGTKTIARGKTGNVTLQPAATGDWNKVGFKVPLPNAKHQVDLTPPDGSKEWYSTMGDNLDVTLTTTNKVSVPAGSPTLQIKTWYEIEQDYDWGFVWASTNGTTWTSLQSAGNTQSAGGGVYGLTGDGTGKWGAPITYDLSAFAGQQVYLQFEYYTDIGVAMRGWEVTDINLNGTPIADAAFTNDGWVKTDGVYRVSSTRYYIGEYRTYDGFDKGLQHCYQWNFDYPSRIDRFKYNRGMHLIYRDTWWADNNVSEHPGEGGWMVVDARPIPDSVVIGAKEPFWRSRIQTRDAAFGLYRTGSQIIYLAADTNGDGKDEPFGEQIAPGKLAQRWFDDSKPWWYAEKPDAGTKVSKLGVRIKVVSQSPSSMKVWIDNKK